MKAYRLAQTIAIVSLASPVWSATYSRSESIVGSNFYTSFNFEAIADPTSGRVNYVDMATAQADNLTFASSDTFILRTDFKTVLDPNGPGRNSVRIRTNNVYTNHVAVYVSLLLTLFECEGTDRYAVVVSFNLRHMPQGCGTWPAVWETDEATWPNGVSTLSISCKTLSNAML